ncbi:hypothetical protein [Actinoallomurus rhizosphaericola]|uniref:hypothetical protein n=1 Tax=Actinoallomurus rhizosphaericola TaxID=2952536 RepID=UPI002093236F|nr:hypothetical protein [Actinoallomurus rhizosphaericola]MCO5998234.1 hypothetical protein [Actinoallomurus rhizosphaericola]
MHFVGSLPPDVCGTPRQAMEWITDQVGDHRLTALPCDVDSDWIVAYLRTIAERPAFEVRRPGEYTGYEDMRRYGVRRGHRLRPADVSMEREDVLRRMLEDFRALRAERPELADVRLQLSLPSPLDLAIFVFEGRPWLSLRHLSVFTQATVDEVTAFTPVGGRDVVWQLETPSVLVGMDMAKRLPGGRSLAARLLARQVAGLLGRLPAEAEVILHLCYGNLGNTELVAPRDLGPAVTYLNLLAPALRRHGRALPPVHLPAAYGAHPSPVTEEFYRPLRRLDPEWRIIAGIAAAADPEGGAESLRLLETAAGRRAYSVATACGLGRHTVDQAEQAVAAMAVAADTAPH